MSKEIFKVVLTKQKETKGTVVYGSDKDDAPIPSVYIKKHALMGVHPETITVTVESE